MPITDLDYEDLIKVLSENFTLLADEVQLLSDQKTILEHKLRFAHEQVSARHLLYSMGPTFRFYNEAN